MKFHARSQRLFRQAVERFFGRTTARRGCGRPLSFDRLEDRELLAASFFAPAEPAGSVSVQLVPLANVTAGTQEIITFGVPFTRGSVGQAQLSQVRVLKDGVEVSAFVEQLTPWRSIDDAAIDGQSVRVARIQIPFTFTSLTPQSVTVQWGGPARTLNRTTLQDPRLEWHTVASGTFVAADNVEEPDVLPVLPAAYLAKGMLDARTDPTNGSVAETRDDPAVTDVMNFTGYTEFDSAQKNFFYTIINQNPGITVNYKTDPEPWLYDRSSGMYGLYLRSGFATALREAVRAADFYADRLDASGFFTLRPGDPKYAYNESLAYTYWLLGDNRMLAPISTVVNAFNGTQTRWTPNLNFFTERNTGYKLLATTVAYEVTGNATFKSAVQTIVGDFVWHQNGAGGQLPANRIDGGLYHTGQQHDISEASSASVLVASSWMSALLVDPMVRVYGVWQGNSQVPDFIVRMGNFAKAASKTDANGQFGGTTRYPDYLMRADGVTDNRFDSDVQHAMDVGTVAAWATYFAELRGTPDASLRQLANDLYATYDVGVNFWTRPGGTNFNVSPPRRYTWEYKNSASFSWALGGATGPGPSNRFTDDTALSGVGAIVSQMYQTNPNWWLSGQHFVDLDTDGDLDLFLDSHGGGNAIVALNDGHGVFTRLTTGIWPSTEIHQMYDINGDGKVDLSATYQDGGGQWWINNSTPGNVNFTATNVTRGTNTARGQVMLDFNRDGKVDWLRSAPPGLVVDFGNGTGGFTAGSLTFAIPGTTSNENANFLPGDFDNDGDIDLLILTGGGYDGTVGKTAFWRNNGNQTFTDTTANAGLPTNGTLAKGIGDYDHDGDLDLIAVVNKSMPPVVYLNNGQGVFTLKPGAISGVNAGTLDYAAWGTAVTTDFDNDGIADIIMNGKYYLKVLRGTGGGNFTSMNTAWGIKDIAASAVDDGLTFGDMDADGDLDIIGYNEIFPTRTLNVYRNDLPAQNWLNVRPVGLAGNVGAAGAKISVYAAGTNQLLWSEQVAQYDFQVATSYYGTSETERHFGLGNRTNVDVVVQFPMSGHVTRRNNVAANQTIRVLESTGGVPTVTVNDGSAQRSRVTQLTVTFPGLATLPATPAAAFRLTRVGPGSPTGDVTLAVDLSGSTATQTVARLTFSEALTEFGSLRDGNYTLTVLGSQVTVNGAPLDGDGDGAPGGDSVTPLFRLFGDVNGDRVVDATDLAFLRTAFGSVQGNPGFNVGLDLNGDGVINAADLGAFRSRFGSVV